MKITKLVQSYSEPEGITDAGAEIEVEDERAKQLIALGFAKEGWAAVEKPTAKTTKSGE
jgi:hypothetical protein